MSDILYHYYERELLFMRQLSQQFAKQYPAAAGRLLLEPNRSVDPHVERLIEAFAFLSGRIQQKLDDDFPELTDSLLSVLYPHYLAPVPSMTVVQFELEPANAQPTGLPIERGSRLHTQNVGDVPCLFRTCYPVTLWPLELVSAKFQPLPLRADLQPPPGSAAALCLKLESQGDMQLADLSLQTLRFHLHGDDELIAELYELIFNNAIQVEFHSCDEGSRQPPVRLAPAQCIRHVGFERDEGLLPYRNESFLGYRLLTEFFTFPKKFHFVDLGGWEHAVKANFGKKVEVVIYLNRTIASLEREVNASTFRLGCTPLVNLFEKTAEPIPLTHAPTEYRVVPDVHQQSEMEVYSVDAVQSVEPHSAVRYKPFYSVRHDNPWNPADEQDAYWCASRRQSMKEGDDGTDVYLRLVDLNFDPRRPATAALVVHTTCTNRDLPIKLQQSGNSVAFELESAVPLKRIRCLHTPTAPRRPPLRRHAHWRLISHLTLNHLSITDPVEGRATLQEILRLYDFSNSQDGQQRDAVNRQIIEGISAVNSRRVVGRTGGPTAGGFCRGVEVTIELDEQKYLGTGAFLFACVLERFLGLYASVNSFTQLVAKTKEGNGVLSKWPPRAGETQIL